MEQDVSGASDFNPVAELRVAVQRGLIATLGDTYDCTRVWSAWGVGTMDQDDFVPVLNRLEELINAVVFEIAAIPPREWDGPLTPVEQAMIDAAWKKHKAAAPETPPQKSVEWTAEEIEDLLADAIDDSIDMDWTSRLGARSILRELAESGLHITLTDARRDLAKNPPAAPPSVCPHAHPHTFCMTCAVTPCPIGMPGQPQEPSHA